MTTEKLSQRAMLVRLRVHMLYGSRTDRQVTDETIERKGAKRDTGRWTTNFIPKESVKDVISARNRIKAIHDFFTLPWLGDGTRILPTQLYDKYMERYNSSVEDWQKSVDDFMQTYPTIREQAERRLAGLLTDEVLRSIPSVEEARSKFSIDHDVFPMPNENDFRVNLGADKINVLKSSVKNSIERMTTEAVNDTYDKLGKILKRIFETLSDKDAKFKNSLIGNLKDLVELMPMFNLNDDPKLEELRRMCDEQLANIDPQKLRDNMSLRKRTAKKAEEIMECMRKIDLDIE